MPIIITSMISRKIIILSALTIVLAILSTYIGRANYNQQRSRSKSQISADTSHAIDLNPLSIAAMRQKSYPGSDIKIEQTLTPGSNYKRYIASYLSDGLKIYALLTVPNGTPPDGGWPAIIFNP